MSNYISIASVSATLKRVLQPAVNMAVPHAKVGFQRPDSDKSAQQGPLVNVYLYQVTPNAAYRNADIPTRRADGTLVERPQAALDLHYLFTFHGEEEKLEPQLLLGAVASTLHAQPLLSRDDITTAESSFPLGVSGLANQVERIRFTPTALSLEEFSKLWSVFFQVEYALSAAYQASVVLIQSVDVPEEALPVVTRNLYTVPFRWPLIDRVISQAGPDQPILSGDIILIQGQQLRGNITMVLIEGQELTPAAVADNRITLVLPPSVHAGVKSLQVIQKNLIGNPPALHRGVESTGVPFVLRPKIVATGSAPNPDPKPQGSTDVTLTLVPNIGSGQRAVLVLNDPTNLPASYVSLPVIAAADSDQIAINIEGVPKGDYLVRVQIDGGESLLTTGPGNTFTDPKVTV